MLPNLTAVGWYFITVLICIALITHGAELLFMGLLPVCISSFCGDSFQIFAYYFFSF